VADAGNRIAADAQAAEAAVTSAASGIETNANAAMSTATTTAGALAGDAADLGASVFKAVTDI
jgi:hypothetical protein